MASAAKMLGVVPAQAILRLEAHGVTVDPTDQAMLLPPRPRATSRYSDKQGISAIEQQLQAVVERALHLEMT